MTSREQFEQWMRQDRIRADMTRAADGGYRYALAIMYWEAWQASRRAALTDYAERMDRAGQPAAALGAILLRDKGGGDE